MKYNKLTKKTKILLIFFIVIFSSALSGYSQVFKADSTHIYVKEDSQKLIVNFTIGGGLEFDWDSVKVTKYFRYNEKKLIVTFFFSWHYPYFTTLLWNKSDTITTNLFIPFSDSIKTEINIYKDDYPPDSIYNLHYDTTMMAKVYYPPDVQVGVELNILNNNQIIFGPPFQASYNMSVKNSGDWYDIIYVHSFPFGFEGVVTGYVMSDTLFLNVHESGVVTFLVAGDYFTQPGTYSTPAIGISQRQLSITDTAYAITTFYSTDVAEDKSKIPMTYYLDQNYPNPFNQQTAIHFGVPKSSEVCITIYNINGEIVEIFKGKKESGNHFLIWDAKDQPSGIYLIRFQADDFVQTKKCMLIK